MKYFVVNNIRSKTNQLWLLSLIRRAIPNLGQLTLIVLPVRTIKYST